ncbi:hypothetical protein F5877DRAFT_86475 [Lentinula edodes]|nr:hypothetical protein F5877DRAFT_86475 [Lentinula edodes]
MSSTPACPASHTPSPLLPTLTALGEVPSPDPESDGEVETDQLAFTIESPSHPQLQLFETVSTLDNPLWLLLAEVASPCTNCVKTPGKYLAYSRRFLELHGTPTHELAWGIPLTAWREYDAALHARTSSTSTLLELNMLDKRDMLSQLNVSARSPMPVAGPSSKKIRLDAPKKHSRHKSPVVEVNPEPPHRVRLVVPPARLVAPTSFPVPPPASPSQMGVPNRDLPMQGPSDLVQLATVADQRAGADRGPSSGIKGTSQDLLSSIMPPSRSPYYPSLSC